MTEYFCPRCWYSSKKNFEVCPKCGFDLREFEKLPYEDKLILALNHPVREYRLNAVRLLGRLKSEKAIEKFREMVKHSDVITTLVIIEALSQIPSEKSLELLDELTKHSSPVISKKAKKAKEKLSL